MQNFNYYLPPVPSGLHMDLSDAQIDAVLRSAMQLWAIWLPIQFTRVYDQAQSVLRINFKATPEPGLPIDWAADTSLNIYSRNLRDPKTGLLGSLPGAEITIFTSYQWSAPSLFPGRPYNPQRGVDATYHPGTSNPASNQQKDLLPVMMHEMGHALGVLHHSENSFSLMYATYSGLPPLLMTGDVVAAQQQFASHYPLDAMTTLIRRNSSFTLENVKTQQIVSDWNPSDSSCSYYYPRLNGSKAERLQFGGGDSNPLGTGVNLLLRTTNTAGMKSSFEGYDQLTVFEHGVGYWNYGAGEESALWCLVVPGFEGEGFEDIALKNGDSVRIRNQSWKQYLCPCQNQDYLWTKKEMDDDTLWKISV